MNKLKTLYVVKVGGQVIDNTEALQEFLEDFVAIPHPKLLIHGGGKLASDLSARLGISQAMWQGRRITDKETLKVATMVYAGLVNKTVVAQLQSKGCNAIGLSGADANCLKTQKREVKDIDYGFVGDCFPDGVNLDFLDMLLANKLVPVLSAITHDGKGQLLNTNADTIAATVSKELAKRYQVNLIYTFEKKGVLLDVNDERTVVPRLSKSTYKQLLKEGIISKGMIPKLDNAFDAIEGGVKRVVISEFNDLKKSLKENDYTGTTLVA